MQFPEVMRHGRFLFDTEIEYAGRLIGITERSIENEATDLALLRLEFEIFVIDEQSQPPRLLAAACIASRDIIVHAKSKLDNKLKLYSELLDVQDVNSKVSWYALEQHASAGMRKWIRIQFGPPDEMDMRQSFKSIRSLDDVKQFKIGPSESSSHRRTFVPPNEVRTLLRDRRGNSPSVDTVVRFTTRFEKIYGNKLVQMEGNQRRINWYLLWHLWESDKVG